MSAASHEPLESESTPVGEQMLVPGVGPVSARGFKRWPPHLWFPSDCRSPAISASSMKWPGTSWICSALHPQRHKVIAMELRACCDRQCTA